MTSPAASPFPAQGSRPGPRTGIDSYGSDSSLVPPRRRAFGSQAPLKPNDGRPSSAGSSTSSIRAPTPNPLQSVSQLFLGSPEPGQEADGAGGPNHRRSSSFTVDGVNKAQAWLSTWAPRGEGRGRAFVNSTLNGVAGVASQVGHEINGAFGNLVHQPNSNAANPSTSPVSSNSPPLLVPPGQSASELGSSPDLALARSPPAPTHTSSTPAVPTKRVLQPANISRLGPSSPPIGAPNGSVLRPSMSHPSTSAHLPQVHAIPHPNHPTVHGPSHLNPHLRTNSSTSNHSRSNSFGGGARSPNPLAASGGLTRSDSQATGGLSMTGKGAGMPYKIGFQPAGVRNDRTEEFVGERRAMGQEREKNEGRLGRRWAKLVDLHFNPTIVPPSLPESSSLPRSTSSSMSISSIAEKRRSLMSIDGALDALRGPKEVWRGVKNNLDPRGGPAAEDIRKRAAEQTIVKWQDDAEAKKCFICQSSFSMSTRKHHCRLCGRVVCSLQPTPPSLLAIQSQLSGQASPSSPAINAPLPPGMRREKCSLLLVADWRTGRGEEVDEGFVGWMKLKDDANGKPDRRGSISSIRTASSSSTSPKKANGNGVPLPQQPREVQVKGVRVCRECWGTVSRKQRIADRQRVSGFARLYRALRSLQSDVEDLMPDFEEHMDILSSAPDAAEPGKQVVQLHKQLLDLIAQYEQLSKRMSSLPSDEGSSQAIVQSAIARSAATFLAMQMVKLQALPRYQKRLAESKRQKLNVAVVETTLADQLRSDGEKGFEDAAVMLQPLLEQEAQLEAMIADAHAQRKYEDSKALSQALAEIKAEITRITSSAM